MPEPKRKSIQCSVCGELRHWMEVFIIKGKPHCTVCINVNKEVLNAK